VSDPVTENENSDFSEPKSSALNSPMAPWIAMAVVVVIALVVVLSTRGGDSDPDKKADNTKTEQNESAQGSETTETTKPKNNCPGYSLGANLLGEPAVATQPGVRLWHDLKGFHVRYVPGPGIPAEVVGKVTPTGTAVTLVEPAAPAANQEGPAITFTLNEQTPDLLFKVSCSTSAVSFDLSSGGTPLRPDQISVGRGNVPPAVPVVLTRTEE